MLQMAISVIALAGTAFGHPLGMLISTANDLIIELSQLTHHLNTGDHQKAVETLCNIMNNIFYLALFLQGGPGFSLASLAIQILMGLYHSHAEFRDGKYIECSGHLLMAVIRGKQMTHQISALQTKWAMESHQKEVIVNPENKADTLIKYGNNPDGLSAFHYAIKKGDKKAVQFFLANGADVNARDNDYTALHRAVLSNQVEIANVLLDKGANIHATRKVADGERFTQITQEQAIHSLRNQHCPGTFGVTSRWMAIHMAAQVGNEAMINLLVSKGANVNVNLE